MPSERIQRQIDALLDEAEAAIKLSDWVLVRDRAQNALALDPENGDAQGYLNASERALARRPSPADGHEEASTPDPSLVASWSVSIVSVASCTIFRHLHPKFGHQVSERIPRNDHRRKRDDKKVVETGKMWLTATPFRVE